MMTIYPGQTTLSFPITLLLALVLLPAFNATAAEPELVPPTPVSLEGLEMPGAFGAEGLHRVRFTVTEEGEPTDITVVGGFTHPMAEQMLRETVSNWTFEPGTENGEPVEFHNMEYILRAKLSDELYVPPDVQERLNEISQLIEEEDYQKAEREVDRALSRDIRSVMDYALMHETRASILMASENLFPALESSRIATLQRVNSAGETEFMLTPEILRSALEKRFILAGALRQYPEAWRAWELLDSQFDIPEDARMRQQAMQIREVIDSGEPLGMLAQITEDQWTHEPHHRIFTVADVDGRLRHIDVRCERRNLRLEYQENVDWTLPEAFGECELDFVGRDGTQFTLYEFSE